MLTELRIQNFAIIDHLELELGPGLVIFTGETGAGKSIIMDAIEMLLGGRADLTVIRADADLARVEGTFRLGDPERALVHEILRREDLLDDPDYVTLSREVRREGRNTARVNGRLVNLSLLKELGEVLVDIHGQSEHLSLLKVHAHLGLLDRYAMVDSLLNEYRQAYSALLEVRRELNTLRSAQRDADRRLDMLTFQVEEIEAARLKLGEDVTLRQERDRLANAEALASLAEQAIAALDEGTPESPSATDLLGQAAQALTKLAQLDSSRQSLAEQASALEETLAELARDLRNYFEEIEFNPKRLEEVEERLDLIQRLERKYGGSIEAVLAFAEKARQELETISNAVDHIVELEAREQQLLRQVTEKARLLSEHRKKAAETLGRSIERELADLKMASARFAVDFQTRPATDGLPLSEDETVAFDANGFDRVEFLVAPNPGEGLKPLAKIASGGETSRLMLALKNVLAQADQVPTLIFDEIDQGIGGRVGGIVGEKLWNLGRAHQVLVITHLPQLAAFGDCHYHVQKVIQEGRTLTRVSKLEGEARLLELAQMLGGVTEGTLQSAYDILQMAQTAKEAKMVQQHLSNASIS
ncbi:MAG: DNA repair protein RecN [Anaerolineales bacterium]|nr:DNA repair protein RecN [Anaerolineales bacterium]MDW8226344.1 DNA repair protein RecN [Anaerolineales bacterium]